MVKKNAIFIGCIITGILCISCNNSENKIEKSNQKEESSIKEIRQGEVKKDLGTKPDSFGSNQQALELIQFINENPGKADYQISYSTGNETILFGCNFTKDAIIRIHHHKDGHGTQEMWTGNLIERLNNAAGGGSLNDTPNGKNMGTFQSF